MGNPCISGLSIYPQSSWFSHHRGAGTYDKIDYVRRGRPGIPGPTEGHMTPSFCEGECGVILFYRNVAGWVLSVPMHGGRSSPSVEPRHWCFHARRLIVGSRFAERSRKPRQAGASAAYSIMRHASTVSAQVPFLLPLPCMKRGLWICGRPPGTGAVPMFLPARPQPHRPDYCLT